MSDIVKEVIDQIEKTILDNYTKPEPMDGLAIVDGIMAKFPIADFSAASFYTEFARLGVLRVTADLLHEVGNAYRDHAEELASYAEERKAVAAEDVDNARR